MDLAGLREQGTPDLRRIAVVGTTGSGKTTLGRQLGEALGVPHVELDALNWGSNWTPAPTEVFRRRVADALDGESWVSDGNYSAVRDIVWDRATTLVWLDYSLWLILRRLTWRTVGRVFTREELWNGNREGLRTALFSRESLFVWALKTHWSRRKRYAKLIAQGEYINLAIIRHRSPRETDKWLAGMNLSDGSRDTD